jgi:hypothetical protein
MAPRHCAAFSRLEKMPDDSGEMRFGFHTTNGVERHYALAGDRKNP